MSLPTSPPAVARRHVLAGDDSAVILDLYREILEDAGYRVSVSATPLSVEDIRRVRPDLVILDHMLGTGEGSGWQLVQDLRHDGELARLPIVVCTGAVHRVRQEEAWLAALGVEVVTKPFDIDDLVRAVDRALVRCPAGGDRADEMDAAR